MQGCSASAGSSLGPSADGADDFLCSRKLHSVFPKPWLLLPVSIAIVCVDAAFAFTSASASTLRLPLGFAGVSGNDEAVSTSIRPRNYGSSLDFLHVRLIALSTPP